ncbi:Alpha/Beta hydrolase protein [Infundibulicybe gibba]|nr:Alpha/Beta hydrolase protein [Infundibulicybe gibba]
MVGLASLVSMLVLAAPAWATPVPQAASLKFPPINPNNILCQLPIIKQFLCPQKGTSSLTVQTPIGTAQGTLDPAGAKRFSVKYASATRWAPSTLVTSWNLPNGATNVTTLPLACPQGGVDPSAYSEDCLSMVLYVPVLLNPTNNIPTLMWIHGGSFIVGSATGPGLDGSKLAAATGSIVAVVQYRLGALGFMSPDGSTNFAVKDLVNALQFLKKIVPSFNGSASKITLAGQSSGANLIRALLATPSASSLFTSAILQSDPMNFGFLSPSTQQSLQSNFNGLINCGASDTSCQRSLSLNAILNAQDTLFRTAFTIDPAAGMAQPIRPVRDGSFITSPLDSTAPFPSVNKPILLSSFTFGPDRTNTILSSPHYPPTPPALGLPDARVQLQLIGTDYLWKCSSWTFARNWVQKGGKAFVGLYTLGASYPGNEAVPFCTQDGAVCHQDDIQIVFGTVANPTPAQSSLISEVQRRYKAFLATGNPNTAGLATWVPAEANNIHSLLLGGSGEAPIGACDPSFWGQSVQYDYQVFGI